VHASLQRGRAGPVSAVRALFDNTRVGAAVALLLLPCATAVAVAGCGGSSGESPQALLADTFAGHSQIESGQVTLSFAVSATGASATKPLAVSLSGPFESRGEGRLPRFALKLDLTAGGHTLAAGATATGSALYVQLAGTWFSTPASTYKALEEGFAQATKRTPASKVHSTFSSLGIEPARWLSNPSEVGTATVAGVQTVHLSADVNVPAFTADLSKLSQAGTALGLSSAVPGGASVSPTAVGELTKSIRAAHVDVYTGASDHTLRRLEVSATVAGTAQTRSLLGGLSTADVHVRLEFADLGKAQSIAAPPNPQPSSQLLPALEQLVSVLRG
jgi:hypothetical protein